jgi:hypothetical protein
MCVGITEFISVRARLAGLLAQRQNDCHIDGRLRLAVWPGFFASSEKSNLSSATREI